MQRLKRVQKSMDKVRKVRLETCAQLEGPRLMLDVHTGERFLKRHLQMLGAALSIQRAFRGLSGRIAAKTRSALLRDAHYARIGFERCVSAAAQVAVREALFVGTHRAVRRLLRPVLCASRVMDGQRVVVTVHSLEHHDYVHHSTPAGQAAGGDDGVGLVNAAGMGGAGIPALTRNLQSEGPDTQAYQSILQLVSEFPSGYASMRMIQREVKRILLLLLNEIFECVCIVKSAITTGTIHLFICDLPSSITPRMLLWLLLQPQRQGTNMTASNLFILPTKRIAKGPRNTLSITQCIATMSLKYFFRQDAWVRLLSFACLI